MILRKCHCFVSNTDQRRSQLQTLATLYDSLRGLKFYAQGLSYKRDFNHGHKTFRGTFGEFRVNKLAWADIAAT